MSKKPHKLLRVEREIVIYTKDEGSPVERIPINISIKEIGNSISPMPDDPDFYHGYRLDKQQIITLSHFMSQPINTDFNKYYYLLDAVGIYDWSEDK